MANHPDAQLGISILTARMAGDREAFMALLKDRAEGEVNAHLMRTAEMMVNMIADLTGQTKAEALKSIALALAAEM